MRYDWYEALSAPRAGAWGPTKHFFRLTTSRDDELSRLAYAFTDARGDVLFVGRDPAGRLTLGEHRVNHGTRVVVLRGPAYRGSAPSGWMGTGGSAVLYWTGQSGTEAMYLTRGWRLTSPHTIDSSETFFPSVAVNRRGQALLSWDYPGEAIWALTIKPSGAFGRRQKIAGVTRTSTPSSSGGAALNDRGQAAIAWLRTVRSGNRMSSAVYVSRARF